MFENEKMVPGSGWFFDLKPHIRDCKVYHNGVEITGVKHVSIDADANNGSKMLSVYIEQYITDGDRFSCSALEESVVSKGVSPLAAAVTDTVNSLKYLESAEDLKPSAISLKDFVKWLFPMRDSLADYSVVLFLATHAKLIQKEHTEDGFFTFYMDNGLANIEWSECYGWHNPEEAIRILWSLFKSNMR
jgi:hypothetical protein